jgi:hypothetical protein
MNQSDPSHMATDDFLAWLGQVEAEARNRHQANY